MLIGPLLHIQNRYGQWVLDWSRPGAVERFRFLFDLYCDGIGERHAIIYNREWE